MRSLVPAIEVPDLAGGNSWMMGDRVKPVLVQKECDPKLGGLGETNHRSDRRDILITSCFAGSESRARPPNYLASRADQSPAWRNDTFGGAAFPQRGLPH